MTASVNVRTAEFGNGYRQTSSAGFNTMRREFSVSYVGKEFVDVIQFAREHAIKPFIWRTPQGDLGLFLVKPDSITAKVVSPVTQEVMLTFSEQFTSA